MWFGIEVEANVAKARRRRRWLEKAFRRLEIVPLDAAIARFHARTWARLAEAGRLIGPHDLIVAARRSIGTGRSHVQRPRQFQAGPRLSSIQP